MRIRNFEVPKNHEMREITPEKRNSRRQRGTIRKLLSKSILNVPQEDVLTYTCNPRIWLLSRLLLVAFLLCADFEKLQHSSWKSTLGRLNVTPIYPNWIICPANWIIITK